MNKEELKELAATLNGIADGKAWEYLSTGDGDDFWTDPGSLDIGFCLFNCSGVRLKPWSLPPPPDGMQWHRDDWTEDMLDGGWRPHLLGEVDNGDEEYLYRGEWIKAYYGYGSSEPTTASDDHRRTKAPLPPKKKKVPLGPSDVPPGSAFTATDTLGYCCPVLVDEDGCYFASRDDGQDKTVSWEAMVDGWQINRSIPFTGKWNPEAWEPCYKLIDTP